MNKIINKILIIIAIIGGVICGVIRITSNDLYGSLICIAIIPVMLIPYISKKIFGIKINEQIETMYLIFVFFAHFLGSIINFYQTILYYDKIMHFLSGILSALIGFIILVKNKNYKNKRIFFNILFIIMITLSIASLWEFYEFIFDNIFNKDAQNVGTTGVDDTMIDMIVAFIGAIVVSIKYILECLKNKKGTISNFIEEVGV